jgi:hypothetical protein
VSIPAGLPGAEIVTPGLADLAAGRESVNADAVAMASIRLRAAGIDVPPVSDSPPAAHRLYEKLRAEDPRDAHSRYNSIMRRMTSFARAVERASAG